MSGWMDAKDAAARLNVSLQTLYAYVSRGLIVAERLSGAQRSRYRAQDVERLATRQTSTRHPKRVAQASLHWGLPVLSSSLTLVQDEKLYYRGQSAAELAEHASLEEIAALLWECEAQELYKTLFTPIDRRQLKALSFARTQSNPSRCLTAFQILLAYRSSALELALDKSHVSQTGNALQLLEWMRAAGTFRGGATALSLDSPMHERLAQNWRLSKSQAQIVRAALVLVADHELNASSFTTRCVTSAGASLSASVLAGLAALSGLKHGGSTAAIDRLWSHCDKNDLSSILTSVPAMRLAFGHPLYPNGDQRAKILLSKLRSDKIISKLIDHVFEETGLRPNIDFALAVMRQQLGLPEGAAFAIFAIGRTVGWVAHALEQQKSDSLIRPRASYVGPSVV